MSVRSMAVSVRNADRPPERQAPEVAPVGLCEGARGQRRSGVAQVRFGEGDVRDPACRQAGAVGPQRGFVGDLQDDEMATRGRTNLGARLVRGVCGLHQLLRQSQVRADQYVGVSVRLGRWASWWRG